MADRSCLGLVQLVMQWSSDLSAALLSKSPLTLLPTFSQLLVNWEYNNKVWKICDIPLFRMLYLFLKIHLHFFIQQDPYMGLNRNSVQQSITCPQSRSSVVSAKFLCISTLFNTLLLFFLCSLQLSLQILFSGEQPHQATQYGQSHLFGV